jgi:uncharacterized protein YdaU (DUF1376 family)
MGRAWMPLYVGDYLRDTRDLNTLQHGAYLLLIMHYWQHDALPSDDARLAAITGLSIAQWRRIREPVQAKFSDGWRHKRIEAEIAKTDRAFMQRRVAGRNGGIKSGIARAVMQGEAIVRAEAEGKRALHRKRSGPQAAGAAETEPPRTNHNHRFISSSASSRIPPGTSAPMDADTAPHADTRGPETLTNHARANFKPANQWSRQELDSLFARRSVGGAAATAGPPDALSSDTPPNPETGE